MPEYKKLDFKYNTPVIITLKYDECKKGEGEYGGWYLYGVTYRGEDYSFFAQSNLHLELSKFKKGDELEITKIDDGDKKFHFDVAIQTQVGKTEKKFINDDRTNDIHRQVCLKKAVDTLNTNAIVTKQKIIFDDAYFIDVNFLINEYVRTLHDKYNPNRPTEAELPAEAEYNGLPF